MDNVTQTTPPAGTAAAAQPDLTGRTLGDFQVLRKLGQGGMGQVYLAEQISLKRKVALKLLRAEFAARPDALQRFKLEAEAAARISHANIVQVYFIGENEGHHYIAMEYVEGRNLRDFLSKKGPPELLLAMSIMRQVAAALQRAGEMGIVHRDIKPENIMLTRKGEVKVADFGLSRVLEGEQPAVHLTQSGVTMGTPLYMSPEQVEGKPLDIRTDIYSFGVSCYHMFAGEPPFRGSTAFEVALKHVKDEPTPLASIRTDLPPEVCAVVHKMMAKDPGERYQTGRDLLRDLVRLRDAINGNTGFVPLAATGFVEGAPTQTPPNPTLKTTAVPRPRPRSKALLIVLFVFSILLAGSAGLAIGWWHQSDQSPGDEDEKAGAEPANVSTPLKERERKQLEIIDDYLDPDGGYKNPRSGISLCLDYTLPLLEQPKRLDDADKLFIRMEGAKNDEYAVVGQLGRAVVFAYKDNWKMSESQFKSLQDSGKKPMGMGRARQVNELIRLNPQFARVLREAIHRNSVNSKGESDRNLPVYLYFLVGKEGPFRGSDRPPRDRNPPKSPMQPMS